MTLPLGWPSGSSRPGLRCDRGRPKQPPDFTSPSERRWAPGLVRTQGCEHRDFEPVFSRGIHSRVPRRRHASSASTPRRHQVSPFGRPLPYGRSRSALVVQPPRRFAPQERCETEISRQPGFAVFPGDRTSSRGCQPVPRPHDANTPRRIPLVDSRTTSLWPLPSCRSLSCPRQPKLHAGPHPQASRGRGYAIPPALAGARNGGRLLLENSAFASPKRRSGGAPSRGASPHCEPKSASQRASNAAHLHVVPCTRQRATPSPGHLRRDVSRCTNAAVSGSGSTSGWVTLQSTRDLHVTCDPMLCPQAG